MTGSDERNLPFPLENGRVPQQNRGEPWYDDGSIILLAGPTAFKVYKGLLTRRSGLFKRLLDRSIPQNTVASLPAEQCLVVQMQHPKDELSLALQLIHAGFESWPIPNWKDFDALARPLEMADKYTLPKLRSAFLTPLFRYYSHRVQDYASWDGRSKLPAPMNPVRVINFAREISLVSLIPVALVDLSLFISEAALHAAREPRRNSPYAPGLLHDDDQASCDRLRAHNARFPTKLQHLLQGMDDKTYYARPAAENCACKFGPLFDRLIQTTEHTTWLGAEGRYNGIVDMVPAILKDARSKEAKLCPNCVAKVDSEVLKLYNAWWKGIPHCLNMFDQDLRDFILRSLTEIAE